MKWLKVTVSLFVLLVWWSISATPVGASSTGPMVEPNEAVKGGSLFWSEPVRPESGPRARVEPARQRAQVERLPRRLPRWYPPRLCGRKSSRGKGQSGGNRRQNRSQKQKRGRLPIEQNQQKVCEQNIGAALKFLRHDLGNFLFKPGPGHYRMLNAKERQQKKIYEQSLHRRARHRTADINSFDRKW